MNQHFIYQMIMWYMRLRVLFLSYKLATCGKLSLVLRLRYNVDIEKATKLAIMECRLLLFSHIFHQFVGHNNNQRINKKSSNCKASKHKSCTM